MKRDQKGDFERGEMMACGGSEVHSQETCIGGEVGSHTVCLVRVEQRLAWHSVEEALAFGK